MDQSVSNSFCYRRFGSPNPGTFDDKSRADGSFNGKTVLNKEPSMKPVTKAGGNQKAVPGSSGWARIVSRLLGVCVNSMPSSEEYEALVNSMPSPEELQLRKEREDSTLAQLEAIMSKKTFDEFQQQLGNKVSCRYLSHFDDWYGVNKFNPELQKILTENTDTDVVNSLKFWIVEYEMEAVRQLGLDDSGSRPMPDCLKLKAEDLFDQYNNYLTQNPNLETSSEQTGEVLAWYEQGVKKLKAANGWDVIISNRSLETNCYSQSEVARKLEKFLVLREQLALEKVEQTMPADAFKEFQKLMGKDSRRVLYFKPGNPLVEWYNSQTGNDPELLGRWFNKHIGTKIYDAYLLFLNKYELSAKRQLKETMGEGLYRDICHHDLGSEHEFYCKLPFDPYKLPEARIPNPNGKMKDFKNWLDGLRKDQLQQLTKGDFRYAVGMSKFKYKSRKVANSKLMALLD